MAPKSRKSKKSRDESLVVDFTGVEVGQKGIRLPEGDYRVRVVDVEQKESETSGGEYLNFKLEIRSKGDGLGKTLYHICSLQPQALFNLRTTLTALGLEVPQKRVRVKTAALIGREMIVTLGDDEYQGRIRSRVVDTLSIAEAKAKAQDGGSKKKATKKARAEEEDDDEEDEEEEDEAEEDEAEDKKEDEEEDDEEEEDDLEDL